MALSGAGAMLLFYDIVPEALSRVPRRSGRLAASIRSSATVKSGVVRAGGAKLPYAKPIHFGWPKHNISPQPFLYEALDARRSAVIDAYVERVAKIVDRVVD